MCSGAHCGSLLLICCAGKDEGLYGAEWQKRALAWAAYQFAEHSLQWSKAHRNNRINAAAALLKLLPGFASYRQPTKLIGRWKDEAASGFLGKPPPGRRSKLTEELAAEVCNIIRGGFKDSAGRTQLFPNMEGALRHSARLRRIQEETGLSPRGLLRAANKHGDLRYKRPIRKYALTDAQKAARVDCCKRMLQLSKQQRRCLVFTDAKKLKCNKAVTRYVLCGAKQQPYVSRPGFNDMQQSNQRVLNYYASASAIGGMVHYAFMPGTTVDKRRPAKPQPRVRSSSMGCSS
jgi:hypothetical protein